MQHKIIEKHGCTVVYGAISVSKMCRLLTMAGSDQQDSPQLAARIGALMVIGTTDNLKKLSEDPETIATAKLRVKNLVGKFILPESAIRWLENGERDLSSESMFRCFTGMPGLEQGNHPHCMSDVRRCRLLLEQVPEFSVQLHKMKGVSATWAELVVAWPSICEKMDAEWPSWRTREFDGFDKLPLLAASLLKALIMGTPESYAPQKIEARA